MTIVVTGAAGFIGYHVCRALLDRGEQVLGIDDLNPYYDVRLKRGRLAMLADTGFELVQADIADCGAVASAFAAAGEVTGIIHLAAQAGVRHSMVDPYAYVSTNVMGHLVMLEAARRLPGVRHFVFASSSSVYGLNTQMPFAETDRVDQPTSLYAATKRADELMSHAYGHLFGIPQTGLRFFTVYGPWGRPDMAYFSFAEAILTGEPITLYDGGSPRRDFTYIDDIVAGVIGAFDAAPRADEGLRLLNIGNRCSEPVSRLVGLLERHLGKTAVIRHVPRPRADVAETFANVDAIAGLTGFAPRIGLDEGVARFAAWFLDYHRCGTLD